MYRVSGAGAFLGFLISVGLIAGGSYLIYDGREKFEYQCLPVLGCGDFKKEKNTGQLTGGSIMVVIGILVLGFCVISFFGLMNSKRVMKMRNRYKRY